MDMQLNKELLRRERELRAWSQSHLAEVAGLSMRTVQRIETSGSASLESTKAIAAAFDTHVETLLVRESASVDTSEFKRQSIRKRLAAVITIFGVFVAGMIWLSRAYANEIIVDLAISEDEKPIANIHLKNEAGESTEAKVGERITVKVTSTKYGEDSIFVDAQVYFFKGNRFELMAHPKLLVANKQSAAVGITSVEGRSFHFIFTPQL